MTNKPAASSTVSVRMYRGLLGDFFFVRHMQEDRSFHMLIDCGVLQCIGTAAAKPSTSAGRGRIVKGVEDLMKDTGGELDLVVATHEHYDHLSGFILANQAFAPLKIRKLWLAWTEDRTDSLANTYRSRKTKALQALTGLSQASAFANNEQMQTVRDLMQFYGDVASPRALGLAAARVDGATPLRGNSSCETVLNWLKERAGAQNVSYLKPGQAVKWGVDGCFRAYVLGPPHDDGLLRQLDPSKGADREVYLTKPEEVDTLAGLADLYSDDLAVATEARILEQPFARGYWRPYPVAKADVAGAAPGRDSIMELYEKPEESERQIETAWLDSASTLALKIDGDVNNTSLALALQLPENRVLLFPADAQVGNWLSWDRQTYPAGDGEAPPQLTIQEILSQVILYKTGHHASHNATLKANGLELMSDSRLCAMIPLVEATAKEQKTSSAKAGWNMPFPALYNRLLDKTSRRIIRGDGNMALEKKAFASSAFKLGYGPEVEADDPLWVELTIKA